MIHFKKSGKTVKNDSIKTILELAEQNDISIRNDCRKGLCGTCKKQKISGTIIMERAFALYPEEKENGMILPCISYCDEEDLILDI